MCSVGGGGSMPSHDEADISSAKEGQMKGNPGLPDFYFCKGGNMWNVS